MVTIGALECIRSGTTTVVQNASGIDSSAAALAQTGLRCVFAESVRRQGECVLARCRRRSLARGRRPKFSAKLRDEGMKRIDELVYRLARREGRDASACFRQPRLPRTRRPNCCTPSAPSPRNTILGTRST